MVDLKVGGNSTSQENDINCWQRPEEMNYPRPVSICDDTSADLAGEIVAALSATSLVFSEDKQYSKKLIKSAEELFNLATRPDPSHKLGKYSVDACGNGATQFYDSSSYIDELIWGGTWLFFATGNTTYLRYAADNFVAAEEEESPSDKGIFYWNNKLAANAVFFLPFEVYVRCTRGDYGSVQLGLFTKIELLQVLMTRIRYFIDLGYPYENALSTNRTDLLMCFYLSSDHKMSVTTGKIEIFFFSHSLC